MTCKDCIHIGVCCVVKAMGEEQRYAEQCKSFKNKADYTEVKHGNWIRYTEDIHRYGIQEYECSECGSCMDYEGDYCSKCGAKSEAIKKFAERLKRKAFNGFVVIPDIDNLVKEMEGEGK